MSDRELVTITIASDELPEPVVVLVSRGSLARGHAPVIYQALGEHVALAYVRALERHEARRAASTSQPARDEQGGRT